MTWHRYGFARPGSPDTADLKTGGARSPENKAVPGHRTRKRLRKLNCQEGRKGDGCKVIYHFSLASVAIVVGLLYVALHLWVALFPDQFKPLAKAFPRHLLMGQILMGAATVWIVWMCATMDLGEFTPMRQGITIFFGVLGILSLWLLTDYLSVRGLSVLLLLAANVLLDGAFLNNHPLKLIIPALAYVWITAGIILICSPYRLRDWLTWAVEKESRLKALAWPGVVFGGILILLGIFVY